MLAETRGAELLHQWHANIDDVEAKDAFSYIVGLAATLPTLNCFPMVKGEVNDFRFLDGNDKQLFAFIVNKGSLLFYFRKPALETGRYNFDDIAKVFSSAEKKPAGEWTVRLQTIDDVKRLWRLLAL